MLTSTRPRSYIAGIALGASTVLGVISFVPEAGAVTAAKAGAKCTKLNATSGGLVCTRKSGRLVWSRPATTTTKAGSASAAAPVGIEGTWKASSQSKVGYRVKEILFGQSTEGVGQTNAITGTLTIQGTKVTAVDLSVDTTTLKSDSTRRDNQVNGRILETAKFPTATLKLTNPIDFGKVPADREEVTSKASATLTIHGVTKTVTIDLIARRNGAALNVNGNIPFVMADFGISDPSVPGIEVEQNGLIEFLVVFER